MIGASQFRVRYAETDQMGIVHHSNYLVWCELGRTDLMRELGVNYAELERQGTFLAVAEVTVRYASPARYDDEIIVRTRVDRVQSRAITFGYEIVNADDGTRIATASTRLVATDADGATRTLPRPLIERFREIDAVDATR